MKPVQAVRCDHCPKVYTGSGRARRMRTHETHCWKNPERTPREGEVYGTSHVEFFGADWEPSVTGQIYHKGEWYPVPGYRSDPVDGEYWPHGRNHCHFTPIDKMSPGSRIAWFVGGAEDTGAPHKPAQESDDVPF